MAGDRGHLRTMRLLPFAAAAVWLTLQRQVGGLAGTGGYMEL